MKNTKKILSLVLVLMMVLSLAVSASAATVTIPNNLSGHAFAAYQIFKGTQADSEGALGDVTWGDGIDSDAFVAKLKTAFPDVFTAETYTAQEVAEKLADFDQTQAKTVAQLAYECKTAVSTALKSGEENDLVDGYYLIVDTSIGTEEDDVQAYNAALLQITRDITISVKTDAPEVEKKVKDTNDTTGETSDWQDSADHDISDAVPFQLTAKLPENVTDYASAYKIVFHDTLSAGLTFDQDSVKVFVGGNEIADEHFELVTETEDDCTFEVVIADVEAAGATNNSVITVEYTATLNENAVIGSVGNPNTVKLEYSNNPNWNPDADGDGNPDNPGEKEPTGETPEDKVIVFTYKVVVNKVDEKNEPLTGAGFTLSKKDKDGNWVVIGEELKGDALTTFEWKGLDDGDYKLVETTTPAGYNTIPEIEFTITAEHEVLSDDPTLTNLEGGEMFTGEVSTGALSADIENKAGATLPETGGMGTTLFYIFGGIMVLAAVVLLVTKKRMSSAE